MNFGPRKMQISIAAMPGDQDLAHQPASASQLRAASRATASSPADARALDQDRVARLELRREQLGGLGSASATSSSGS